MATQIRISSLRKIFRHTDGTVVALRDISFEVEEGGFVTVVGPSGCGKSTMLNIVSGIDTPSAGEIAIATKPGRPAPRVGYVFQAPRLLPWMSVMDNMLFVRPRDTDVREFRKSAERYLQMVGLERYAKRFPLQLSGGMQQRVGIARALAIDPDVLLMDEPFSHLDEINAEKLRGELLRIWSETGKTIIFVTHDLQEAITLGDRMIIFSHDGQLKDDIPISLPRPRDFADAEVAAFLGECTRLFSAAQHDTGPAVEQTA